MNIKLTFDSKGIDNLTDDIVKQLEIECEQGIKKCAYKVEADAKELCPVDTSRLRDSINTVFSKSGHKMTAEIGTDVEYALIWACKIG